MNNHTIFLHDQKVKTTIKISWDWKELWKRNKRCFSLLLKQDESDPESTTFTKMYYLLKTKVNKPSNFFRFLIFIKLLVFPEKGMELFSNFLIFQGDYIKTNPVTFSTNLQSFFSWIIVNWHYKRYTCSTL